MTKPQPPPAQLPDIRPLRPGRYVQKPILWSQEALLTFQVAGPEDFDWLEQTILDTGYYELPGVWTPDVNHDKRAMAEILSAFGPNRVLEIGCGSGPVLQCLAHREIRAEGVEISRAAIDKAPPQIRRHIHHGDLLDLDLSPGFDLVFGLDVFEHLNPNRLDSYLEKVSALLRSGGWLFANIPAFSHDPVFGLVFPVYLQDWYQDIFLRRHFRVLHVDGLGYPVNGHLIWADSLWWVEQFTRHGFRREPEIEQAIHQRWDYFFDTSSEARKTFYVLSKDGAECSRRPVIDRMSTTPSQVLREWYFLHPPPIFTRREMPSTLLESERVFFKGWHDLEIDAIGPFRWSLGHACIRLTGTEGATLSLLVFTAHPRAATTPVTVRFLNHTTQREITRVVLETHEPAQVEIPVPTSDFILELIVDRTWIPRFMVDGASDLRELGVGVRSVRFTERKRLPWPADLAARLSAACRRLARRTARLVRMPEPGEASLDGQDAG